MPVTFLLLKDDGRRPHQFQVYMIKKYYIIEDLRVKRKLSISEIEKLGYYDFMAYLEVPFFNIGGNPSLDLLAERCNIGPDSHVLDVGCGTGLNSVHLAKKYGCMVTGIDISEMMIEKANERVQENGLEDQLEFQVGDAYNLDFPDLHFDAILTVFVSQFLDLGKAFTEFYRVLSPGGYLGINEMYRADDVPEEALDKVDMSEQVFRDLTDLPFRLRSPTEWERGFHFAEFTDIDVETFSQNIDTKRGLDMISEMGGWSHLLSLLWDVAALGLKSGKIRQKYGEINKGKRVMMRDKESSKYIGYVLGVGKKRG
jgi:ubiquinone/menaquinone biosynthesis C-methylase UbiE